MKIESKYSIGDVVYRAGVHQSSERTPCPDCLDTRKCQVTTKAGETFEANCPRCYWNGGLRPVVKFVPDVRRLTIGSVRLDTFDEGFSYMCEETGVGSGSVYRESDLFINEAEALASSITACALRQADHDSKAETQWEYKLNQSTFTNAQMELLQKAEQSNRWKLIDAHKALYDDAISDAECREELKKTIGDVPMLAPRL